MLKPAYTGTQSFEYKGHHYDVDKDDDNDKANDESDEQTNR